MLSLFLSGAAAAADLNDDVAGLGLRLETDEGLFSVVVDLVGLLTDVLETAGLVAPPLSVDVEVAVEVRLIGAGAGAGCLVVDVRSLAVVVDVASLPAVRRSAPDAAVDMRFGLAEMPIFSFFDSSSVILSVALLSFDAVEGCGLWSDGVKLELVVDVRGLLAVAVLEVRALGLVDVLFKLEVEVDGVVEDATVLVLEDTVGRLNLSATEGGRAVVELFSGLAEDVFLTVLALVEPVVAAVFERLIPGVGAVADPETEPDSDAGALIPSSATEA